MDVRHRRDDRAADVTDDAPGEDARAETASAPERRLPGLLETEHDTGRTVVVNGRTYHVVENRLEARRWREYAREICCVFAVALPAAALFSAVLACAALGLLFLRT